MVGYIVTWLLLGGLWIGLSGFFDAVHLTFGAVSVTLVTALSARYLTGRRPLGPGLGRLLRLALYCPWLLWQIVLTNMDVLLRVLGMRRIDPQVIRFCPNLRSDFGIVTLANSITLTPGTVTVEVTDGEFIVHAIAPEAAAGLADGPMVARARQIEGGA